MFFLKNYKDRIKIYISNSEKNFKINKFGTSSNNEELNGFFLIKKVNKIENGFLMLVQKIEMEKFI